MKKILLYLTIIPMTISMAASDFDLKFATNFGVGLEGGTYYNLYGSQNHSKKSSDSDQAIFKDKISYTGSFEAKIFKSFSIRKDLKVKFGAGVSIDITKLPELNEFVEVITSEKKSNGEKGDSIGLPHTSDYRVGLQLPFQQEVNKIGSGQWGGKGYVDADKQMSKLIDLSRKTFYTSLTAFGSIEIEKILKNFSVYFGLDAGVDIVLDKTEEKVVYEETFEEKVSIWYLLERRKSTVRPKVKGYTGINYKGFETEIGLGYPQFVTIGIGYRFNL